VQKFKGSVSQTVDAYLVALLLFSILFFFCRVPSEIFGWYSCVTAYLLPAILVLISLLKPTLNWVFILFSAFIVATGAEHISLFFIITGSILLYKKQEILSEKRSRFKTLLFTTAVILIAGKLSPGLFIRYSFEKESSIDFLNSVRHLIFYQAGWYFIIGTTLLTGVFSIVPSLSLKRNYKLILFFTGIGYLVTFLFDLFMFSNSEVGARLWFLTNVLNIFFMGLVIEYCIAHFQIRLYQSLILWSCTIMLAIYTAIHLTRFTNYTSAYDRTVKEYQAENKTSSLRLNPDPGLTSGSFPDFRDSLYINFYRE
jgi:hypothetical protein